MIKSFKCKDTAALFELNWIKKLPSNLQRIALRKLSMIDAATSINDLRVPPANHLEKLRGDLKGHYSIRINIKWRICFKWSNSHAYDVEIINYH